jgi:hypothetical protein
MARKKSEKKVMPSTAGPKLVPVRLGLTPEEHRLLRLVAADDNRSMASFARLLVARGVREEAKQRGIKS